MGAYVTVNVMKILIVTQVLDSTHPILGFFHRWVEEFAVHCEKVHVICLQEGVHNLPKNVTVHSLGKNEGKGRLVYLWRFYTLIWKLRHEYENIFVHMNQMYVILAAPFWRALRKHIGLWYAHGAVSTSLRIAIYCAHVVFTSTPQGLQIDTPKRAIVGQGIDMSRFVYIPRTESKTLRLVTVGRISKSKQLETLINACHFLKEENIDFIFTIVGCAITEEDKVYEARMHDLAHELALACIVWHGSVQQTELPALLAQADVFIHDGVTNSLDKVLVEAVACGVPTISSNPAYRYSIGDVEGWFLFFPQGDAKALAERIYELARKPILDRNTFTQATAEKFHKEHSLPNLISAIVGRY